MNVHSPLVKRKRKWTGKGNLSKMMDTGSVAAIAITFFDLTIEITMHLLGTMRYA